MNNQSVRLAAAVGLLILGLVGCGDSGAGSSGREETASPPISKQAGDEPGSAAREAGRNACAGMTPLEAAKHFKAAARRAGVKKRFAELTAEPPPSVAESPGYPRLVAALYATTVPGPRRAEAAAGCAEELAAH